MMWGGSGHPHMVPHTAPTTTLARTFTTTMNWARPSPDASAE